MIDALQKGLFGAGPEFHIYIEDATSVCTPTEGCGSPEGLRNPKLQEGRESNTGPAQGEWPNNPFLEEALSTVSRSPQLR